MRLDTLRYDQKAMGENLIERRTTGLYIAGTRVPIDAVVWEYRNGEEAACIQSHYPILTLEEVKAAIAYYLGHRDEVHKLLEENEREEEAYIAANPPSAEVRAIFERMRHQTASKRS